MSEKITYAQLQAKTAALEKQITQHAEAIRQESRALAEEARDTQHVAEQIAAKNVDSATVGETRDLARVMQGLADSLTAYATAGNATARRAKTVHDTNRDSHSEILAQVRRSQVGTGIYILDRIWLEQN
ncbi:hypothetical protein [Streptomyces sp. NPDC060243]|uniref:hypothetical protein n=1 Tax=Streptomyces sp. NPDC060243 TaxID=3347081 RepID=UPI00365EAB4F